MTDKIFGDWHANEHGLVYKPDAPDEMELDGRTRNSVPPRPSKH